MKQFSHFIYNLEVQRIQAFEDKRYIDYYGLKHSRLTYFTDFVLPAA